MRRYQGNPDSGGYVGANPDGPCAQTSRPKPQRQVDNTDYSCPEIVALWLPYYMVSKKLKNDYNLINEFNLFWISVYTDS